MTPPLSQHRKRLLLIACSQRKLSDTRPVPAIERYDGPAFRVLRKYLSEVECASLAILIVSAEFGLIAANRKIPDYDRRMSIGRASELAPSVKSAVLRFISKHRPSEIGICLGRDYANAISGLEGQIPKSIVIEHLRGGLGPRLSNLHRWLRSS